MRSFCAEFSISGYIWKAGVVFNCMVGADPKKVAGRRLHSPQAAESAGRVILENQSAERAQRCSFS